METVLIFFLMALFGMAVMIITLFCFVWALLNFEVE
jgi:hypothetical protein